MFVTLEDETGPVNVIVWPCAGGTLASAHCWSARLLAVEGVWQCSPHGPDRRAVVRHLVYPALSKTSRPAVCMAQALQGSRDFSLSGPGQLGLQLPGAATRRFPMHAATLVGA